MTTARNVLDAVSTRERSSREGVMQRLFASWFDAFIYNQIWEDPTVDVAALQLDADSRVLTISSGGCNALNYLVSGPESVTAADINRYHIYLLRLKVAALRYLPDHDSFFALFGLGIHADNRRNYERYIAENLDADTRNFWESNGLLATIFRGDRINYFVRDGLYEHSRNGYFLRFFARLAKLQGLAPERILKAQTLEEQQEIFRVEILPFFDLRLVRLLGRLPVTMFGLGIPPQQFEELKTDLSDRTLVDVYTERVRRLACDFPVETNYFAWQAFGRHYDSKNRNAIPDYLRAEYFERLQQNAYRIRTEIGSVTDLLRNHPAGTFNRFVFLDAQDWMDGAAMIELWDLIAKKADLDSRVIFRTAAAASPLEKKLPPGLLDRFQYERDLSHAFFKRDRASIYGGFHLYVLTKR